MSFGIRPDDAAGGGVGMMGPRGAGLQGPRMGLGARAGDTENAPAGKSMLMDNKPKARRALGDISNSGKNSGGGGGKGGGDAAPKQKGNQVKVFTETQPQPVITRKPPAPVDDPEMCLGRLGDEEDYLVQARLTAAAVAEAGLWNQHHERKAAKGKSSRSGSSASSKGNRQALEDTIAINIQKMSTADLDALLSDVDWDVDTTSAVAVARQHDDMSAMKKSSKGSSSSSSSGRGHGKGEGADGSNGNSSKSDNTNGSSSKSSSRSGKDGAPRSKSSHKSSSSSGGGGGIMKRRPVMDEAAMLSPMGGTEEFFALPAAVNDDIGGLGLGAEFDLAGLDAALDDVGAGGSAAL